MPSPLSIRSKAFLGVVLCVGVWGVNYPATKIAYRELSPLAYTGWRFLIAAALILGWAVRNGAPVLPPRGLRRYGLLLALTGIGVYQPIFAIGVERTSGFAAALLNSTSPLLALLIVAALGYERIPAPRRRRDGGGVVRGRGIPRRRPRFGRPRRAFREPPLPRVRDVLGDLQRLLLAPFEPDPARHGARDDLRLRHPGAPRLLRAVDGAVRTTRDVSTLTWVILVLSAVFPLYASFRLWAHALAVLGVAATTRVGVLVPVVAGVSSALWTGERFSGAKVASAAVVLGGLALARLGASRDLPPAASG